MFSALRWLIFIFLLAGTAVAAGTEAQKEAGKPPKAPSPAAPAKNKSAEKPSPLPLQKPALPDEFKINMLIRTTVIAVNQANQTGNYTVLRDLGSPRFKEANSAERLSSIFEALRKAKFDLSPVIFFTPKLMRPPVIEENGMLGLTGFFDTRPQQVAFDLLFENVEGDWRIYGINIATQQAPTPSAQGATPPGSTKTPETHKQ